MRHASHSSVASRSAPASNSSRTVGRARLGLMYSLRKFAPVENTHTHTRCQSADTLSCPIKITTQVVNGDRCASDGKMYGKLSVNRRAILDSVGHPCAERPAEHTYIAVHRNRESIVDSPLARPRAIATPAEGRIWTSPTWPAATCGRTSFCSTLVQHGRLHFVAELLDSPQLERRGAPRMGKVDKARRK